MVLYDVQKLEESPNQLSSLRVTKITVKIIRTYVRKQDLEFIKSVYSGEHSLWWTYGGTVKYDRKFLDLFHGSTGGTATVPRSGANP